MYALLKCWSRYAQANPCVRGSSVSMKRRLFELVVDRRSRTSLTRELLHQAKASEAGGYGVTWIFHDPRFR